MLEKYKMINIIKNTIYIIIAILVCINIGKLVARVIYELLQSLNLIKILEEIFSYIIFV